MDNKIPNLVAGNNQFALDLYMELSEEESGNLCFSPYSILIAMAMTYAGARGETEKQMAEVLHFSTGQDELHKDFAKLQALVNMLNNGESIQLLTANALFPEKAYSFLEEFLSCLKENYQTSLTLLDYERNCKSARQHINDWVKERTRGKICQLIPPDGVNPNTTLVLVNAIYFKGLWQNQFNPRATYELPFWISADEKMNVPMMSQRSNFGFLNASDAQILEMDYAGGQVSMVFILPKEKDGLAALQKSLSISTLNNWLSELDETEVDVRLPRFAAKGKFDMGATFVKMGMSDAFDQDRADFSGMDGQHFPGGLYIDRVFHQATTEVNEEGAVAGAATAVVMAARAFVARPTFYADHPFLYLIREKTSGNIFFLGHVNNPCLRA